MLCRPVGAEFFQLFFHFYSEHSTINHRACEHAIDKLYTLEFAETGFSIVARRVIFIFCEAYVSSEP